MGCPTQNTLNGQPLLSGPRANLQFEGSLGGSNNKFTLGFCSLYHRSIGIQNSGFYFLDPPGVLDFTDLTIHMADTTPACMTPFGKLLDAPRQHLFQAARNHSIGCTRYITYRYVLHILSHVYYVLCTTGCRLYYIV